MELLSSFDALYKIYIYIYSNKKVDIIYLILLVREGNIFVVLNGSSVNLELDIRDQ